jgi:hypothetical protein
VNDQPDEISVDAGTDLEYDLAHDVHPAEPGSPAVGGRPAAVSTGTPEYDGDYSYDLAHDVPGR